MPSFESFNQLPQAQAIQHLYACCASTKWAIEMAASRPFSSLEEMLAKAKEIEQTMQEEDWDEAFRGHPMIGRSKQKVEGWAAQEQKSVQQASEATLEELEEYNHLYYAKFGFIFIVCATGKASEEMLELLKTRYQNTREEEVLNAAQAQSQISVIRLRKLFPVEGKANL